MVNITVISADCQPGVYHWIFSCQKLKEVINFVNIPQYIKGKLLKCVTFVGHFCACDGPLVTSASHGEGQLLGTPSLDH